MSEDGASEQRSAGSGRRRGRTLGCVAVFLGIPLAFVATVFGIWLINNRPQDIRIPTHALPSPNAYDGFVRAARLTDVMKHRSPPDSPDPEQAESLANLAASTRELAPAHAALRAALRERHMHPPERSFGFDPELHHMEDNASFRTLCRELIGEAMYWDKMGKPARAVDTLLDGVEMAAVLPRGGGAIDALVGDACEGICLAPFEPLLRKLTPVELAAVQRRLATIQARSATVSEVEAEEANVRTAQFLGELRELKGYQGFRTVVDIIETDVPGGRKQPKYASYLEAARFMLSNKDRMAHANRDYVLALAREAIRPYTGPSKKPCPANFSAQLERWMFDVLRPTMLMTAAVLRLLSIEAALLRYRANTGAYPASLRALVPAHLGRIPPDPFAGRAGVPPVYRLTKNGKGFLLYSLGPDLRDNGGMACDPWQRSGPADLVAGHLGRSWWHKGAR